MGASSAIGEPPCSAVRFRPPRYAVGSRIRRVGGSRLIRRVGGRGIRAGGCLGPGAGSDAGPLCRGIRPGAAALEFAQVPVRRHLGHPGHVRPPFDRECVRVRRQRTTTPLPPTAFVLEVAVRLHDLVESVGAPDGDRRPRRPRRASRKSCSTLGGEVGRLAGVRRQPDAVGQPVHRVELVDGPFVGQHAGEADGTAGRDRPQGVAHDVHADELDRAVDAARHELANRARRWCRRR